MEYQSDIFNTHSKRNRNNIILQSSFRSLTLQLRDFIRVQQKNTHKRMWIIWTRVVAETKLAYLSFKD